jgi:ribonuclease I
LGSEARVPRPLQGVIMRLVVALMVLLLAAVQSAASAPREITGAGFRYYVLSLYWLPTLCIESPDSDECRGPTRNSARVAFVDEWRLNILFLQVLVLGMQ